MLLKLKDQVIYGPVQSRRLGPSLGINLLPGGRKVCSFDCLYCQYGLHKPVSPDRIVGHAFPTVNDVMQATADSLDGLPETPGYLTFSGNGEPTLHPQFPEMVRALNALRDTKAPGAKTAILSNSSTVNNASIRDALSLLDVRIMKLDAGTPKMLAAYNRPHATITLKLIVDGLIMLKDVTIQALFTTGLAGNFTPDHIESWIEQMVLIKPVEVQLYSLDRAAPSSVIKPVLPEQLAVLQAQLAERGITASVF